MSNRTAEATQAVDNAWKREQELVAQGKGTRDWTPEEQHDILTRGKAYDENGDAYQGHHMKSVEKYPQYQGDEENIQFLSRSEHLDAHNGWFQNPTNGCYDPETGETEDFGPNKYTPCEANDLSDPIGVEWSEGESMDELANDYPAGEEADEGVTMDDLARDHDGESVSGSEDISESVSRSQGQSY